MVSHVRSTVIPKLREQPRLQGLHVAARSRGEGVGISFWESEEAMKTTDSLGDQARQGAAEAGSGADQGAQRFEVAIDTMA
jgi:hypothetical protein